MKKILKTLLMRISAYILQDTFRDCATRAYHEAYLDSLARRHTLPRFPSNYSRRNRTPVPFGLDIVKTIPLNHPTIKRTRNFLLWCEDEPD